MPEELNALLVVSLMICGGSALILVVLWYTVLGSKPRDMLVKALGEFERQQADDDRVDPEAPIEPRQERKLSDVMREKVDEVDFDEALQRQQADSQPQSTDAQSQQAPANQARRQPQSGQSDVLQPGDPLIEHDELPDDKPIPPQNPPDSGTGGNTNTN